MVLLVGSSLVVLGDGALPHFPFPTPTFVMEGPPPLSIAPSLTSKVRPSWFFVDDGSGRPHIQLFFPLSFPFPPRIPSPTPSLDKSLHKSNPQTSRPKGSAEKNPTRYPASDEIGRCPSSLKNHLQQFRQNLIVAFRGPGAFSSLRDIVGPSPEIARKTDPESLNAKYAGLENTAVASPPARLLVDLVWAFGGRVDACFSGAKMPRGELVR